MKDKFVKSLDELCELVDYLEELTISNEVVVALQFVKHRIAKIKSEINND